MFNWLKQSCSSSTEKPKSAKSTIKGHILVVDPSTTMRAVISELLKAQHYRVTTVQDQTKGINVLESDKPDLAIIEIQVLETGELKLISEIKCLSQSIPVILTGSDEKKDSYYVSKVGADGFLEKPFSEQKLLQTLTSLLTKKGK